jgi:hypothetical protein
MRGRSEATAPKRAVACSHSVQARSNSPQVRATDHLLAVEAVGVYDLALDQTRHRLADVGRPTDPSRSAGMSEVVPRLVPP